MPNNAPLAKLTRPSAAGLLKRERLFSLLDSPDTSRFVWVAAPAGAGKSSLVSSWIEARQRRAAWYEADTGDADPATLFHYLGIAARTAAGRRRVELPPLTPECLPGLEVFVRRFFETFFASFKAPLVLVFDNCQDIPPPSPFHTILDGALRALPPGGQIVCLSREAPPAALARWSANGSFRPLGFDEIKLTDDEAQALAGLGDEPNEPDLARMIVLARGWAAGLKLLLQAQAAGLDVGAAGGRTPQLLFDYLAVEVLDQARPELRDFLLKTALLPSLTADVARQLSGQETAEQTLDWLHRNRLFTDRRMQPQMAPTYEYHPLIREFLIERARRELSSAEFSTLQQRAAGLLEAAGQADAAAALWRDAQDWSALQRLIGEQAPTLLAQGRIAVIEAWILAVPEPIRQTAPWLLYWLGVGQGIRDPMLGRSSLALAYTRFRDDAQIIGAYLALAGILQSFFNQWGDFKPLDPWITEFERLLAESDGAPPPPVEAPLLGSCLGLMFRRPDHPLLPQLAERAAELVQTDPDVEQRLMVAPFAILYFNWRGEFGRANALCEHLHPVAAASNSVFSRILFAWLLGYQRWHEAEHQAANASLGETLDLARQTGMHLFDPEVYSHIAYTALSGGDVRAAEEALDTLHPLLNPERAIETPHYAFQRAGVLLAQGRHREAIALASEALPPIIETGAAFGDATFRIQLGQMLMLDGQHGEARQHLERALEFARRMPSDILQFHALMALAWSYFDSVEPGAARELLAEAMSTGARHNYMNCHPWWIPKVMSQLCARALESGIEADYVRRLIAKRQLAPPTDCLDVEGWPWPVRLYTLGRFAIVIDGEALRFATKAQKKPLELLKALIAQGSRGVCLQALVEQLWPELDGDAGRNAFHLALRRLRRLLGTDGVLALEEGKLTLDPRYLWVDAWSFERLAGQLESFGHNGSAPDAGQGQVLAARLLRLYPGHFLRDEEAPWAIAHRERLRSKFLRAGALLGVRLERTRHFSEAADLYRRALELDALAEEFHRGLMRCLAALGRIAEALDSYRRCRDILSVTLGVAPSAETQAVYQALKS